MARQTSLWDLACGILRRQARPGESCEQMMNRLWTKDGAVLRPSIWRGSVDIYFEHWTRERLAATIADGGVTGEPGSPPEDPPIVVRWRGSDYWLDGRGPNEGLDEPRGEERRDVLILDIGNVAGDI